MGWSRFETVKAMLRATGYAPNRIYLSLTQGAGRSGATPA